MKKVLSILLAVVFFISSTGFTISSHKCGGKIHKQQINIVAADLGCGMEKIIELSCEDNSIENNCCQNEFQNFKITDNFQVVDFDNQISNDFLVAFRFSYVQLFNTEKNTYGKYINYSPPLPDQDIPVLIQSFLI